MQTLAIRNSLDAVRHKSATAYLNYFAHRPARLNPDWTISASERRAIRIRWPRSYEWASAARWVDSLAGRFAHLVRFELADIPQPYQGTVVFRFDIDERSNFVAIGYSDYAPIDEHCARNCEIYFKMQYAREGYGYANVIPGGYVPDTPRLYLHLARLRQHRDRQQFRFEVYGRFGREFGRETREHAISLLQNQERFPFEGGLERLPYHEFVEETARSKICIDLPGTGDFCFRLMNYLAIGSCVVALPHRTALHVPLTPGKHVVYTKPDFSDSPELCEYYLAHANEREEIAHHAREYFDLNLHKDNLARYYLRTCLDRLG